MRILGLIANKLTVAVNIGLEMLETPAGRTALRRLGHVLVQARAQRSDYAMEPFAGDHNRMEEYVDHLLEMARGDFPRVTLQRFPGGRFSFNGSLMPTSHMKDFRPKQAAGFAYNLEGQRGESGRWLEGVLYGVSLELYNEKTEGPEQLGRPYILDRPNSYRRINPRAVVEFVTDPRQYRFPFPLGKAETRDDLRRQGLRNTGSTSEAAMPAPQSMRAMQSLSAIRKLRGYSIHIDALRQRPSRASVPLRVTAA
ncbi:hypothetical protein F4859DRAFT_515762 [Xylaria cf. heliscus]|nr:hypothetical protein F4859DRAFT_515762 [Xylaria cf. heliscus]